MSTSRSTLTRSRTRKGSTAFSCCVPTPISTRSKPCSATSSCGPWSKPSEPPSTCSKPVFHKLDETIRGRVFCSFLALVLKKALEDRIAALGHAGSWPEIIADLDALTETEIEHDGKRFLLRSAPRPAASLALRAAGVALPPTVRQAAID